MKKKTTRENISLRDFFAGCAMAGLRALPEADSGNMTYRNFSVTAFKQADSMLIERKNKWIMHEEQ